MSNVVKAAAAEVKRKKAEKLRLKRPACKTMCWYGIEHDLDEIQEDVYEGQWMSGKYEALDVNLEGTLDSETVFELQIAFSDLADECARMQQDMYDLRRVEDSLFEDTDEYDDPPVLFDCFFPAINYNDRMWGYDVEEHDYYGIDIYQEDAARNAARVRLKRLSKDKLLECAGLCMEIARQYMSLRARYDGLSTAIQVLKGEFEASLEMVTHIENLYAEAEQETRGFKYNYGKALDRFETALYELPERIWIE